MKIRDLVSKEFLMDEKEELLKIKKIENSNKPIEVLLMDYYKARYNRLKDKGHEYFKILKLAVNYSICMVSLKRKISAFPTLKRGTKGHLLEDRAFDLFKPHIKLVLEENARNHNTKLVLFDGYIFGVPYEYLRII